MSVLLIKQQISISEPPFGALRLTYGALQVLYCIVLYMRFMFFARWKARSRLPIGYNSTFFACSHG